MKYKKKKNSNQNREGGVRDKGCDKTVTICDIGTAKWLAKSTNFIYISREKYVFVDRVNK